MLTGPTTTTDINNAPNGIGIEFESPQEALDEVLNQFGSHDDRVDVKEEDEDDENEHLDSPDVDDEDPIDFDGKI